MNFLNNINRHVYSGASRIRQCIVVYIYVNAPVVIVQIYSTIAPVLRLKVKKHLIDGMLFRWDAFSMGCFFMALVEAAF